MTDAEELRVPITADDRDFNRKFDNVERRFEQAERKAKAAGGRSGGAFLGGFFGAAAGFVAGEVLSSGPVGTIFELFTNTILVGLLPLIIALLPALRNMAKGLQKAAQDATNFLNSGEGGEGDSLASLVAGGATLGGGLGLVVGSRLGPAGAAAAGAAGAAAGAGAGYIEYQRQQEFGPDYRNRRRVDAHDDDEQVGYWVGPVRVHSRRGDLYGPTVTG